MPQADIHALRAAAGARYAAALAEFDAAFTDLAGIDRAMLNAHVHSDHEPVRTFARLLERHELAHPTFAPHEGPRRLADDVEDRAQRLIRGAGK